MIWYDLIIHRLKAFFIVVQWNSSVEKGPVDFDKNISDSLLTDMRDEEEVSNDNNEELDDDSDDDDDDDDDNNSFIKNDHERDSVPDESSDDEGIDNSLIKDTETMADFF